MAIANKIAGYISRSSWIRKMFEEGERLRKVFGIAESFIIAHSKANILRAVRLIEYQIEHGQGAIPLPAAA